MKLIAHRALINGPNSQLENHPDSIQTCLDSGYDVEVDVHFTQNCWYLGHDNPKYQVNFQFLEQQGLWIHAKNSAACFELNKHYRSGKTSLNYFWHENDARVLTSCGYLWTFPGRSLTTHSIAVLPETYIDTSQLHTCKSWNCYAICSDYVKVINNLSN